MSDSLKMVFAFFSEEAMQDELNLIKYKYGKISILIDGFFIYDRDNSYPMQWWAPPEAINDYNNLINSKYLFTYN
jgi:hypothetical protein